MFAGRNTILADVKFILAVGKIILAGEKNILAGVNGHLPTTKLGFWRPKAA